MQPLFLVTASMANGTRIVMLTMCHCNLHLDWPHMYRHCRCLGICGCQDKLLSNNSYYIAGVW